jgi:hypothetical protein
LEIYKYCRKGINEKAKGLGVSEHSVLLYCLFREENR